MSRSVLALRNARRDSSAVERYAVVLGLLLILQAAVGGVAKISSGGTGDLGHSAVHLVTSLA
ncbi:MAG TPA: hypothetical protein VK975_05940 [Acidimicrobiales bacterium]|nr:hypothetical protein [Acidimicrobiales bacterium]